MPRYAIRIDEYYLEWSTIVDAPITMGMTEAEYREFFIEEYGRVNDHELDPRLKRAAKTGTSRINGLPLEQLIRLNRAGPNESTLTLEEIKCAYCEGLPIRDGWMHHSTRGWVKEKQE